MNTQGKPPDLKPKQKTPCSWGDLKPLLVPWPCADRMNVPFTDALEV